MQHAVEADDLHVRRGRTTILRGATCRIATGRCTAIVGANGSGKTTLTRALTGHALITSGSARVLGETIGRTDIRALRQRISIVNPTTATAHHHVSGAVVDEDLTSRDAVLTGFYGTVGLYEDPDDAQRQRADQVLEEVGLGRRRDLCFALLSTGEQRRCLIARALVHRPELLILDEPTAGLDPAARETVLATIEGVIDGDDPPTVLIITHHIEELAESTGDVLLMKDGRFIATGPPGEVLTDAHLSEAFGCAVTVHRRGGRFWLEAHPRPWRRLLDKSR